MSLVVLTAAAVALLGVPAEAATKRSVAAAPAAQPVRGQAGVVARRSPTRVTVTRRSYLDAGTEVYQGSKNYTDYIFPPNARGPIDYYLPGEANRSPLPHPWWLHSYRAPSWGY